MTDREGGGACRSFKSTPVVRVAFGTCGVAVNRPRAWAEGMSGLDLRKRHGALRSNLEAERIELGNEPPLSVDGETERLGGPPPHLGAMVQRTILTGLCGAALMGGAVFAALDGETNFATVPERVEATLRARERHRRTRGQRDAQGRSAAAARRGRCRARGHSRVHDEPREWNREIVRVRPSSRGRQSVADGVGALRQYSGVQCAEDAGQSGGAGGERRRRRRRRARRGGLVFHSRSHQRSARAKIAVQYW